ncbi:MAG: PIN/TRAM domain-containing protein [Fusobacteriota bacterium]
MTRTRGLFFILFFIFIAYEYGSDQNQLAYLVAAALLGWGVDNIVEIIYQKWKMREKKSKNGRDKILDTSAIIDGRIIDILKTGFVEGDIIIPRFVIEELQVLADSKDNMKRAKGREALDLIKYLQNKEDKIDIKIIDKDYEDIQEVDAKLVKLGKEFKGDVITTDFNLNKVATIQGVKVLNVNQLSNALKPVVIPNEELTIELMKKGDREGQAVGYLNDGTMVVAEDGLEFLGETITLVVTSVYPTDAGRMIFGKVKR